MLYGIAGLDKATGAVVNIGFQTSISAELEMQGFSVADEIEYSREGELLPLQRLIDYKRRYGDDLDKVIAGIETIVKALSDPWARSPFSTSVNHDDDWTKISDLVERMNMAQRNDREMVKKSKYGYRRHHGMIWVLWVHKLLTFVLVVGRDLLLHTRDPRAFSKFLLYARDFRAFLNPPDTSYSEKFGSSRTVGNIFNYIHPRYTHFFQRGYDWYTFPDNYHSPLHKIEQEPLPSSVDLDQDNFRVNPSLMKNHSQQNTPP